jgi:hypothetical protein
MIDKLDCHMKLNAGYSRIWMAVGLFLIFSDQVHAQNIQPNYGRGPAISPLGIIAPETPAYGFAINNGVNCPTSTFSVGGFSSTGRDWADDYQVNSSASTGLANFGLAAGIRVPIGGRIYSEYCKSYAKSLSEKTANDMLAERRNYQLGLLRQCNYLSYYGVNLEQKLFEKGNAFEDLGVCRDYNPFVQGSVGTGPILDPPQTEVKPIPEGSQILQR